MAKDLKSILAGVKSSKIAPPDIDDKNIYQWNAKDGVAFIKKHKIETHDDRAGNGDDVYKGKTKKTDKYKFQSDGVYEESEEGELDEKYMGFHALKGHLTQTGAKSPAALAAWIGREKYGKEKFQAAAAKGKKLGETHVHNNMSETCNHTNEGTYCEMHGTKACPSEDDVNMQKKPKKDSKGREYLADKKKTMEEGRIEDDAQRRAAKELSAIAAASNKPVTKLKPGKKQYNQLKSTGGMFGGARTFAAGVAKRNIEGDIAGAKSVTKAKVGGKLKEEQIDELYGKGKLDTILKGIESKQDKLQKQASRANYLMAASRAKDSHKGPDSEKKFYMSKSKELRKEEVEQIDELSSKTLKSYVGKVEKRGETEKRSDGLYNAQKGIAKQSSTKTLSSKVSKLGNTPVSSHKHDFEYDASRQELKNRGIHNFAGKRTRAYEEVEYIEEKLTAKDPVSKWIHDFVHSDNPKFAGKSTKERQKMALGAYYGEKRGKKESGSATNTDYTGPGAAGWTTGRHDMGTL